ncbi:FAD-dependent oxidoreductase [Actinotalea caeni]|uniref:FAD-dependent oxidoreductase n=1 Tax=Actinotalea caeni TaxID=1348467 RepID=UPI00195C8BB8|nr:FAD-dependent oxidoreductase [Actinotalea caeni]
MPQPPAPAGPAESDASAHEVAPAPVDAQLDAEVDAEVDVVVAGGGTGGATAALAAAELGARVLVVERDTGLGGVGTRAGVHFYYWGRRGGLQDALDKEVRAATPESWGAVRGFHPVAKQVTVESRLAAAGVQVVAEAVVGRVHVVDGRVAAVDVEGPEGRTTVRTRVLVDATGNGDVAALAGARYRVGRAWDQVMNTYSYVPRYLDADGRLTFANYDCGWLDSTDPDDVSRALVHGRAVGLARVRAQQGHTLLTLGPQLGVREGRRVVGRATLRQADVLAEVARDDVVMRCRTHHDTHARDYANESDLAQLWVPVLGWRRRGFRGDVPYGALLADGVDGLLIGCRAFSGDQDVAAGVRMQRDMHRLGEAAGVAAGLAVALGVAPHEVPVERLQAHLRDRGVLEDLAPESVPTGPRTVDDALALLGGEDESDALWWFREHPGAPRDGLHAALAGTDHRRRRGAAFALALLGDDAALPVLREVVLAGDDDAPGDPRLDLAAPRWVAALVLLRLARDTGVVDVAIERLAAGRDSATTLYLLHHLHGLAFDLTDAQRARARDAVERALERPGLGEDFAVQSSERTDTREATLTSIRWNIELTASAALDALGGDGRGLRDRWRDDEQGAARRFVRHLEAPVDPERLRPLPDRRVDVVVAGGGLAGVAAALEAAGSGARVLLVEHGPVLGREVTAARRTATGAADDPLLEALRERGCVVDGHLDAPATAVALDALCAQAGIEVLLHATPGDALAADGAVTGLAVTTVAGPLTVRARAVVDATAGGRVVQPWAEEVGRDDRTGVVLLVEGVADTPRRWSLDGSDVVLVPAAPPGWANLRVLVPVAAVGPGGLLATVLDVFEEAVRRVPALHGARLALPADEPLAPDRGGRRLRTRALPRGLAHAGATLADAPSVEAPDPEVLGQLLRSGRTAARRLVQPAPV